MGPMDIIVVIGAIPMCMAVKDIGTRQGLFTQEWIGAILVTLLLAAVLLAAIHTRFGGFYTGVLSTFFLLSLCTYANTVANWQIIGRWFADWEPISWIWLSIILGAQLLILGIDKLAGNRPIFRGAPDGSSFARGPSRS